MKNIVVYSSDTCPYCVAAKNFLTENGFEYEERNINQNEQFRNELVEKGYRGVPVIIVDDEEIAGFDQRKLQELLGH